MAIFYRMNSLSRVMEDALRRNQIPYQIARGVEFYNRKEIKDVLAYLRVIANPDDEVSLSRIVNVPTRRIGDAPAEVMQRMPSERVSACGGAMLETGITGLSARAVNSVVQFVKLIESFRIAPEGQSRTMRTIMEAGDSAHRHRADAPQGGPRCGRSARQRRGIDFSRGRV